MSDVRPARGEKCSLCGRSYEDKSVEAQGRFKERMSNALAAVYQLADGEPTAELLQRIRDIADMKVEPNLPQLVAERELERRRKDRTNG